MDEHELPPASVVHDDVFVLPTERLRTATIGAQLDGVSPVDLAPRGASLEAGTVVLVVDDFVPPDLRYGCFG